MIKKIKQWVFAWRFRRAVRKADRLRRISSLKYLVIVLNGKLEVVARQDLRRLIRKHYFRKGTRIEHLEKLALYITR